MIDSQFAKNALQHFDEIVTRPGNEQEALLFGILEKNRDTAWGQKFGFAGIRSVREYQDKVPFSNYEDYEALIEREIAGERGVFTAAPPFLFSLSSGTTGAHKYFPLTMEDARLQYLYWDGVIQAMIRRDLPQYSEEELFGNIFITTDVFATHLPDGSMTGVRSGVSARLQHEEGTFPYEHYYAPEEVLFPKDLIDMQYVKLRLALAQKDITAIYSVFIHKCTAMLKYLERHYDEFVSDIETGDVNPAFGVPDDWAAYIKKTLPPDPVRAAELKSFAGDDLSRGMIKKIWPNVKYLRMISGMQFHPFVEIMDHYSGGLPVYPFVYASSEGMFCLAAGVGKTDAYIPIPDCCFFEFLPEEDDTVTPLLLSEIQKGKRYEIVITTVSGLYRYRIGDVIEVVDFYDNTPVIRINYRKNQVLNLADEKMNAAQFEGAIHDFLTESGLFATGYCVMGNYEKDPPCYRVLLECDRQPSTDFSSLMDEKLSANCYVYAFCRESEEISEAELFFLKPGTFDEFERFQSKNKQRTEQIKPLKIITSEEQIQFFNGKLNL